MDHDRIRWNGSEIIASDVPAHGQNDLDPRKPTNGLKQGPVHVLVAVHERSHGRVHQGATAQLLPRKGDRFSPIIVMKGPRVLKLRRPRDTREVELPWRLSDHRQRGHPCVGVTPIDLQAVPLGIGHREWHDRRKELAGRLDPFPIPDEGIGGDSVRPAEKPGRGRS